MSFLETVPNEIFIKITNNLSVKDLQACRLVSSLMRERINRLYSCYLCVIFNEKSERKFVAKRKPPLFPPFTRMRIESVSYFRNAAAKNNAKKTLRKEYFLYITELDITEFIPKSYFHQIIKLTECLRILKLSSAVLGGSENLFGKDVEQSPVKPRPMLFLRRALPHPLIQNILQQQQTSLALMQTQKNKKWRKLQELHIRLDYVCPSTPNFSPLWLVGNLRSVQYLPVPKLSVFTLTVEKSKEGELFYFTVTSLLNTIPVVAYSSLKNISVISPKCRPVSQYESLEKSQITKQDFSTMQLSELTVKISEGHRHAIPENLMAILEAQQNSQNKTVSIEGIRNAHILKLIS